MKTKYLLIGLNEERIVQSASLSSTGISTEDKHFIVGIYIDTYNTMNEAMQEANNQLAEFEHGVEIKAIFSKD